MRIAILVSCFAAAMCAAGARAVSASEDMIILEQEYKVVETGKGSGPDARETRQVLYITKDIVAVDEFGGDGAKPTETYIYDMQLKRIKNIDHAEKKILIDESFDDRRAQLQRQIKVVQGDLDAPETTASSRARTMKMFATMIDSAREFQIVEEPGEKEIAGVKCKTVKVIDAKDKTYPPLTVTLHPEMEMPYDNSDVLFLLKAVGENMSKFLKAKQTVFSKVPMEMHVSTVEGGKLDTKVTKVTKMKLEAFDPKTRALGNPFATPEGYTVVRKPVPKEKPKEKPE